MKAKHYNDTYRQAQNYAAADRSDPFTFNRIMAHINSGLCDNIRGADDMRYKAEPYQETRRLPPTPSHPEGEEYKITAYKNMQRP